MMRLRAFVAFHKSMHRIAALHDVTIHSYNHMFETGRKLLREPGRVDDKITINSHSGSTKHPLKVVTYHSRDVYPQLLRSTLLIRLVAIYEVFLIDAILEISDRSIAPFLSDKRHELSQRQLLQLADEGRVKSFIVENTLRQLTSGGFNEIRKFYMKSIGFDVLATGQTQQGIQEIHDRRHLFVHRSGFVDERYTHAYPAAGYATGDRLIVDEPYFKRAKKSLHSSALHIKHEAERRFPSLPDWRYINGSVSLAPTHEQVVLVSFVASDSAVATDIASPHRPLTGATNLGDILVWAGQQDASVRMVVAGQAKLVGSLFRMLHVEEAAGKVRGVSSQKLNR